jgi:phosphoribosyl-ATP pyrophosphohydrolase
MLPVLFEIIRERKDQLPINSYTARLFAEGEDAILKKVGEEAMEVILAAKSQGQQRLVEEVADLFYHILVLLASRDLTLDDIDAELQSRRNTGPAPDDIP